MLGYQRHGVRDDQRLIHNAKNPYAFVLLALFSRRLQNDTSYLCSRRISETTPRDLPALAITNKFQIDDVLCFK